LVLRPEIVGSIAQEGSWLGEFADSKLISVHGTIWIDPIWKVKEEGTEWWFDDLERSRLWK
jgi:hypothetical protein